MRREKEKGIFEKKKYLEEKKRKIINTMVKKEKKSPFSKESQSVKLPSP